MEIWIAVRPDTKPGSGTQSDPYNGSEFDAVMGVQPPGARIHIGGGKFRRNIANPWQVKAGQVISGVPGETVVQFYGNAAGISQASIFQHEYWANLVDKLVVEDILFDCNWAELALTADMGSGGEKKLKTGAVVAAGSGIVWERLRVINSNGSLANQLEQFAFCMAGRSGVPSAVGNVIKECVAEQPAGNYGSPYALFGQVKSEVIDCSATGRNNGTGDAGWVTGGVNLAAIVDCVVYGCTFIDCMSAAYHDTDTIDGFTLRNCVVVRGGAGFMNNSPNADKNLVVKGNRFSIQNRQGGNWSLGIGNIGTGTLEGIDLEDNEILADMTGQGNKNLIGISLRGGSGGKVLRNVVNGSSSNFVPPGTQCFGNRDSSGKVVPGLLDTVSPGPVPPGPVVASS